MKKIITFVLLISIIVSLFSFSSFALGEVAGDVYATDVVTYINDAPITSYNIGGKTLIDAEILNWYYGFDVYWLENERKLTIDDKGGRFVSGQAANGELVEKYSQKPGEVVGKYYNTDIVALLNGRVITSYNIGGRTVILAEEMAEHGYDVVWDENKRTLRINKPNDLYKYETPYGTIKSFRNYKNEVYDAILCEANVCLIKNKNDYSPVVINKSVRAYTNLGGIQMINIEDFVDIFDAKINMREETLVEQSDDGRGNISMWEEYVYRLEFFYDNNKEIEVEPMTTPDMLPGEWPVPSEKDVAYLLDNLTTMDINGVSTPIYSQNGGKTYASKLLLLNGDMYIPVQMVAHLMDYDLATLNIVSYSVDK